VCKEGVLLVADKRLIDPLVVPEAVEKTFKIDDHIAAAASGILSDARVLIERAQLKAQQHTVTFDSPIDVLTIVRDISDLKQICTQSAGLRPFGVSLLVAGVDEDGSARLFETDPTGIFFQYRATVIGEGESDVEGFLHKQYKPDMTIPDGIRLAVKALKKALGDGFKENRLDCAYVSIKDRKYKKLSTQEIEKILLKKK
ncbi:archaeal proteasome endopeptidase complex subunit alpha, partial [Candidatus Woesearchaeota archaeon]|nr:archaeal proteasome endopeptidase complex subunit alpha [Candidatus Woesearchaeota archaeon]